MRSGRRARRLRRWGKSWRRLWSRSGSPDRLAVLEAARLDGCEAVEAIAGSTDPRPDGELAPQAP